MKRTFIFSDDKSNKFWTIEVNGDSYTVNYGKAGTAGQTQTKDFADETACNKAVEKLIAKKTKKGYVEELANKQEQQTTTTARESKVDTSSLPQVFKCTVDIMKNGRAIEYRSVMVNWDPYDDVEDPCGILIRADRMHYKVMPTPELAVIDGLKIIGEKLAKGDKFSTCENIVNGKEEKISEEQLREWIKIATETEKTRKSSLISKSGAMFSDMKMPLETVTLIRLKYSSRTAQV